MALCLIASNHVYRDLQQGGVCGCVHCKGFCSCKSNTRPNGPWIENPKKRDEPVPHVHIEVARGECGARHASVSGGNGGKRLGMHRDSDPSCPLSEQKFLLSTRGYLAAALHHEFASGIKIAEEPKPHCQNHAWRP